MDFKTYKWCAVPQCTNTIIKTPEKLFIIVPKAVRVRKKWLQSAQRDPASISTISSIYFCEDHFDLPNDMENYMEYHIMGSVRRIAMKPGTLPTKFLCQSDQRKRQSSHTSRPLATKREKRALVQDCCAKQQAHNNTMASNAPSTSATFSALERCGSAVEISTDNTQIETGWIQVKFEPKEYYVKLEATSPERKISVDTDQLLQCLEVKVEPTSPDRKISVDTNPLLQCLQVKLEPTSP